jgi:hypothetical protein
MFLKTSVFCHMHVFSDPIWCHDSWDNSAQYRLSIRSNVFMRPTDSMRSDPFFSGTLLIRFKFLNIPIQMFWLVHQSDQRKFRMYPCMWNYYPFWIKSIFTQSEAFSFEGFENFLDLSKTLYFFRNNKVFNYKLLEKFQYDVIWSKIMLYFSQYLW